MGSFSSKGMVLGLSKWKKEARIAFACVRRHPVIFRFFKRRTLNRKGWTFLLARLLYLSFSSYPPPLFNLIDSHGLFVWLCQKWAIFIRQRFEWLSVQCWRQGRILWSSLLVFTSWQKKGKTPTQANGKKAHLFLSYRRKITRGYRSLSLIATNTGIRFKWLGMHSNDYAPYDIPIC